MTAASFKKVSLLCLSALAAFAGGRAEAAPEKVVVFLAMPGAGKSSFAKAIQAKVAGAPMWSSGDVIRKAVADRFGTYTIERDKAMRQEMNKVPGTVGRIVAETVLKASGPLGIVEGFRTPEDLTAFKKAFPEAMIVSMEVGAQRRYDRMLKRGRPGEDSIKVLRERDASEIQLGVRRAMKLATVRLRPSDAPGALDRSVASLLKKLELGQ